jgi:hypothetical protein
MKYLAGYRKAFQTPRWPITILCLAVGALIPILGPMVIWGYIANRCARELVGDDSAALDFDFNQLSDYLLRGALLFLGMLVTSIVVIPLYMIAYIPFFAVLIISEGEPQGPMLAVAFGIMMLIYILAIVVQMLVLTPLAIRGGLSADIGTMFEFKPMLRFLRTMWLELVIGHVVLMLVSIIASIVGLCALIVGVFIAAAVTTIAYGHLMLQVYTDWIDRGGEQWPIKLAPQTGPPAPPAGPTPTAPPTAPPYEPPSASV